MVLDGGGDDVLSLLLAQLGHTLQGPVVRLGAAGGEVNLLGLGAQTGGNLRPCLLQVALGLLGKAVEAGGVAVLLLEIEGHGPEGRIRKGRCGRMVGIDESRHGYTPLKG